MADPFVAEIRIFAGNFAPTGWALCNGQLLSISQNTALFSLLGTSYGGDGRVTFGLPDLQGSAPMHQGQGPGLSQRFIGEQAGEQAVTLVQNEMPVHSHALNATNQPENLPDPANHTLARANANAYVQNPGSFTQMNGLAIGISGDGESTFALPNLQSRVPIHVGPGLALGQQGGEEQVTLTVNQIPAHGHALNADENSGTQLSPTNNVLAQTQNPMMYRAIAPTLAMNANSVLPTGGSQPHDNMLPFLVVSFIIALFGIFPSRN